MQVTRFPSIAPNTGRAADSRKATLRESLPVSRDMLVFGARASVVKAPERKTLFPPVEPYNRFTLPVPGGHTLYVEESGNPKGYPVIYLHGGPGGGLSPTYRRFFDPKFYRIVMFDQRGAGQSTPHASLDHNTTQDLVADIERIRKKLNIDKWMAYGGSWGSTLALAYAQKHPERVSEMVLRGIFMSRPSELTWLYRSGAHNLFPDEWEKFQAPLKKHARRIPDALKADNIKAYYFLLTHPDEKIRLEAARAWAGWEASVVKLIPGDPRKRTREDDLHDLAIARIECHYFINNSFLEDDQLLRDVAKVKDIPIRIVQGRYDTVCPAVSAWDLYRALQKTEAPDVKLELIADAGHASLEPGIVDALVRATDSFKQPRSNASDPERPSSGSGVLTGVLKKAFIHNLEELGCRIRKMLKRGD